jgi:hypothetical protein
LEALPRALEVQPIVMEAHLEVLWSHQTINGWSYGDSLWVCVVYVLATQTHSETIEAYPGVVEAHLGAIEEQA